MNKTFQLGEGSRLLCLISSLFEIINQKIRLFYCSYSKSITSHSKYLHLIASAEGRASDSILQITCKPDKALTLIYSTWESLKFHYFHSSNQHCPSESFSENKCILMQFDDLHSHFLMLNEILLNQHHIIFFSQMQICFIDLNEQLFSLPFYFLKLKVGIWWWRGGYEVLLSLFKQEL